MKRKRILIAVIPIIIAGLSLLTLYLLFPALFQKGGQSDQDTQPRQAVQYTVLEGDITHSFECKGLVASEAPETQLEELVIKNANRNNFEMCMEKGEKAEKGEPLYRFQKKEFKAEFNALIVDVRFETGRVVISLLNYDNLFITAQADAKFYDYINYGSTAMVSFNGIEYEATVEKIGYEIQEGMFQIQLKSSAMLLPGTEMKAVIQTKAKKEGLYLPADAILSQGEAYYVNLLTEDGAVKETTVTLGSYFSVEEDGSTFEYVEIKSGVSAGDTVVTEGLEDELPGKLIKEQYGNG